MAKRVVSEPSASSADEPTSEDTERELKAIRVPWSKPPSHAVPDSPRRPHTFLTSRTVAADADLSEKAFAMSPLREDESEACGVQHGGTLDATRRPPLARTVSCTPSPDKAAHRGRPARAAPTGGEAKALAPQLLDFGRERDADVLKPTAFRPRLAVRLAFE